MLAVGHERIDETMLYVHRRWLRSDQLPADIRLAEECARWI
jgi:hypothetical protein